MVRAGVVAAATLLLGGVFATMAGPDDAAALAEADAADAAVVTLERRLESLEDERADAVALRQGERLVESLVEDRVPWEILLARLRTSTPLDTTLLSVTARAAQTTATGRIPGQIELTAQAPTQMSASSWLTVLGEMEGLRRPWLSASATADEDGVAGQATFTITVELEDDFSALVEATPGAAPTAGVSGEEPS
jgi:hypothetical protein